MNAKRLSRTLFAILVAIFLTFVSLALLSQPASHVQARPISPNAHAAISGTVVLWHAYTPGGSEEAALMQVIAHAHTANPGVTITAVFIPFAQIFNQYETEVAAGGGPDMFIVPNDNLGNHARAGLVRNLDSYLQGRLGQVYTTAIDGMKVDGHLYGVPESAKAVALYYNTSHITTPPTDTAGLLALVHSGKKIVLNQNAYHSFGFWRAFGGQLMDANGRCIADRGGFNPAMQYLLTLKNAGATFTTNGGQADSLFKAGTVSMIINGPWMLNDYRAVLGSDLGVAVMPAGPVNPAGPLNGIDGFYVNPNTIDYTSTIELALFMTNQASAQQFTDIGGHIPIRSDVASTDPLINAFAQASAQGFPRPQSVQFGNYWGPFGAMVDSVLSGVVSPATGVMNACDTMNQANGFPVYKVYLPLMRR